MASRKQPNTQLELGQPAAAPGRSPPHEGEADRKHLPRRTDEADRQEFFLPVSGFVWLFPEEVAVVDHPAFQRLGRIYQLGQTHLVYRGATHKRMEHALGAVQVIQRMMNALKHTSEKSQRGGLPTAAPLQPDEARFTRLGALLHDIGHVAAGHTLEDELGLIPQHDGDQRLDLIFEDFKWDGDPQPSLAALIDERYAPYMPAKLAAAGIRPSTIARLLIRKPPTVDDRFAKEWQILLASDEIRINVCRDMIGDTICADLLDYLHRDWYHIGKPRPVDERILQYMEVRNQAATSEPVTPKASDQFVVSLGKAPKIRTDAVSAILELLEWRYQLAEAVLFHRTKLAAAAMLDRALFALWGKDASGAEQFLVPLSDEQMLVKCRELAESKGKNGTAPVAATLLGALERRELFSGLTTKFFGQFPVNVRAEVIKTYSGSGVAAANRHRVLSVLEDDFDLEPGSLAMYCPTGKMNAKIAEVKIALGSEVLSFNEFEKTHGEELSGGHLAAQIDRFKRLWRVHFFISKRAEARLGESVYMLRQAVDKLALNLLDSSESHEQILASLAVLMTNTKGSPWYGRTINPEPAIAAYRQPSAATGRYPFGASPIKSYIQG